MIRPMTLALCAFLAWGFASPAISAKAEGKVYSVSVKLQTPKRPSKRAEGKPDEVLLRMWIPDNAKTIRGAVFNPFYLKAVGQKHWQAACRRWNFALVSANYFSVKQKEFAPTLKMALSRFAKKSGRPEIAGIPLCPVGMSAGAGMSTHFAAQMPERIIAAGPVCLEVGPRNEASYRIPMITIFGERDGRQMEKLTSRLRDVRTKGAQFATAVQWRRRHEFGRANNLLFALFDRAVTHRCPTGFNQRKLKDLTLESGWLGNTVTWNQPVPAIAPYKKYRGDKSKACWFPDGYVAHVWQAFVVKAPAITIKSPAGLGDGQPFQTWKAGERIQVAVRTAKGVSVQKMELWDGDRRLSAFEGPATTIKGLDPGIHSLIAKATLKDGTWRLSRPNTIVVK